MFFLVSFFWSVSANVLYPPDILNISISPSEIQRENHWQSHGASFDEFLGVEAFSNRRNGKYQCTELVHRFLKDTFSIPTRIGLGLGHANTMVKNIYNRFGSQDYPYETHRVKMKLYQNGRATVPPAVGSPINFRAGRYGHAAIVRFVETLSPTEIRIFLFEQHGFPRWSEGEDKPLRHLTLRQNENGIWRGGYHAGIGQPIHWINFQFHHP